MALKILGQATLTSTTEVTAYPCSLGASAVISSIIVHNTSTTVAHTVAIYQCKASISAGPTNIIAAPIIPPGESFILTAGLTLGSQESIRMISAGAGSDCVATISGDES